MNKKDCGVLESLQHAFLRKYSVSLFFRVNSARLSVSSPLSCLEGVRLNFKPFCNSFISELFTRRLEMLPVLMSVLSELL